MLNIFNILKSTIPKFIKVKLRSNYNKIHDIMYGMKTTYHYNLYKNKYQYNTIYIVAGNRTASTWLVEVLATALDGYNIYRPINYPTGPGGVDYDIDIDIIKRLDKKLHIVGSHTPAKQKNIELMDKYFKKYIVTIRDPKDVVVSLYFQINKNPFGSAFMDFGLDRKLPWNTISPNDLNLNKKDFIDLLIDRVMPGVVNIMLDWVNYSLYKNNILVIKYEDLTTKPVIEIKKIMDFFKIDIEIKKIEETVNTLNPKNKNPKFKYFLTGKIGNWQEHLSSSQIKDINNLSKELLKKANYE